MTLYRATAQGQVPMTPEEEAEFLAGQAADEARQNATEMQAALTSVRELREKILNRLAGIGLAAVHSGDTMLADAILTARQSLLDITADPGVVAAANVTELKAAIKAAYAAIVAAAPESLHSAFDQVDA